MNHRKVGRPFLEDPSESRKRPVKGIRAFPEEWEMISRFVELVRESPDKAKALLVAASLDGALPKSSSDELTRAKIAGVDERLHSMEAVSACLREYRELLQNRLVKE